VATLKEVRQLAPEKERYTAEGFQSLAIAPGGKILATANGLGEVRLWGTDTGKELGRCQGGGRFATALAFSADGKMLAGVDGGLVRLWDTASGKEVSSAGEGHRLWVSSITFTSDGGTLISSGHDGFVRLWDTTTGAQRQHIAPAGGLEKYQPVSEASELAPDGKPITVVDHAWPIGGGPFGAVVRLLDHNALR